MKRSDFSFSLPQRFIAQRPADRRDESLLLVLRRPNRRIEHRRFRDIVDYLVAGDVLVVNDTQVLPWKVTGRRITGGRVEGRCGRDGHDKDAGFCKYCGSPL